jgi:predicted nucleic acid-binding protein
LSREGLLLIADTNVLYSALAYKGLENRVLFSGFHLFVTTSFNAAEIFRILTTKRGLSRKAGIDTINSMPVMVVSGDFIEEKWNEAKELIGRRDVSDIPLVALALTIEDHDGIWSSDRDFEVVSPRFKVWRTRELIKQ